MFPEWTWVIGFAIGAAIGSFLNVVIYRLPRGLPIYRPTYSFCPICKNRLTIPDLVPLLSWLFLRGKCRHCKAPVAPRYFIVELITATLWGLIWHQQLIAGEDPVKAIGYCAFAAALVAAIFTDLAHYIIPDQINAFLLFIGLAMNAALLVLGWPGAWLWGMPSSVAGALVGIGALWGIAFLGRLLFGKDAMGHGDIKMARGIGAVLLPLGAGISFSLAVILGAVIGLGIVFFRKVSVSPAPAGQGGGGQAAAEAEEEEDYEPESLGSLLWCGLGYVLCIDVIGLAFPKLYERWFGENPYSVEAIEDDPEVELTMIPFGPYLAAGGLGVALFGPQLQGFVESYLRNAFGS